MVSYLYKPECPFADKQGMVEKFDFLQWEYYRKPDNRMMIGNEPVTLRFISDEIPPTRHMASGKLYTSKKKFRNETRAYGCVEVGNENLVKPKQYIPTTSRKETREAIRRSIRALKEETLPPQELAEVKRIGKQVDYQNRNRRRTK
jgi:hypothetical protein